MNTAIKVSHLTKIYKLYDKPVDRLKESLHPLKKKYHKDFYALSDINFEIKKGETVGIIGKNGAGKSTLLKIITGVLTPSSGHVHVNGRIASLLELGAGFNPEYTGIENIYLQGTLMGYSHEEMEAKIDDILAFADIGDFVYQPVKMYSSGMFARLAFAVAINVDPDILIVDEALSVGDIKFQAKCFQKFEDLKQKNTTILFVSHDISAMRNFCSACLWIDSGSLLEHGDVLLISSKYLGEMYNYQDIDQNISEIHLDKIQYLSNFDPINRWGKIVGCIEYVEMLDKHSNISTNFDLNEIIQIKCRINLQKIINKNSLISVAIAIKNSEGHDIIVSSTTDNGMTISVASQKIEILFECINYLQEGEYILAVAIEDRANGIIEYYDYIEGAKYFSSNGNKQLHGMFHQPFSHKIKILE